MSDRTESSLDAIRVGSRLRKQLGDVDALARSIAQTGCWITTRSLPKGFALLESWGFRSVMTITWCEPSIGVGNYFRSNTEQVPTN